MLNNDQLSRWDRENFIHPSSHYANHSRGHTPSKFLTGASGVYIEDRDGTKLLDAFAGLYCVNVGYGRETVIEAVAEQARKLAFYHSYTGYSHEASVTLAKMVIDRSPDNMSRVYFGLSGSDANETNIKLVWYYNNILGRPNKKKIISRWRSYHGSGLMTGSLTGLDLFHKKFDLPMPQVLHTEAPYYFHRDDLDMSEADYSNFCAQELEAMIEREGPDTIAAFIAEPVLGTGGIVPPPAGYWPAIQKILRKYDILMIADEVVTGFGRTGSMMGIDHYDIHADIIAIAKGLTSGYAPLSGSIISKDVWSVLEQGTDENGAIGHGWTYSAHPIGAAAGVANLQLIDDEGLIANNTSTGDYLRMRMNEEFGDHPNVGDIRGVGMFAGVEFVEQKQNRKFFDPTAGVGAKVAASLLSKGVIARAMPQSDVLGFSPPFCLTKEEADIVARSTGEAIRDVFS